MLNPVNNIQIEALMDRDQIEDQLLANGPEWADESGNTALHHAARLGDEILTRQSLQRGVKAWTANAEDRCARDVARIWGHDAVAAVLNDAMKEEPAPAIPYASLQDIRDAGMLHRLVTRGQFPQVLALDPQGLSAADYLSRDAGNEMLIVKICLHEQLPLLMKPELWAKNPGDLLAVIDQVPKTYLKEVDARSVLNAARQMHLRSRSQGRAPGL